jgi:catechol 2,3-dioxygenase-like lactoylglutathione lyase family enzyme
MAGFHHVEIWLADLPASLRSWEWLMPQIGFVQASLWDEGQSWEANGAYLTLTASPNLTSEKHDRRRPGLNHLAFTAGSASDVDRLMEQAPCHGWVPLYQDRYPHAGGPSHYAGWLENAQGFKVELVAE